MGVYGGEGTGAPGKNRRMRGLPEYCEECRREIRTLERCVVTDSGEEKRAGQVTFRESAEAPSASIAERRNRGGDRGPVAFSAYRDGA